MTDETKVAPSGSVVQELEDRSRSQTGAIVLDQDGTVVAPYEEQGDEMSTLLGDMGIIMPLASPEVIRKAFAHKQKVFAAILSPEDYLYTVTTKNAKGYADQLLTDDYDYAIDRANFLKGKFKATPKKSGIVKLARALGITARIVDQAGLPKDPNANYSWCKYEARHERTGTVEFGEGFCDAEERRGRSSKHSIMSTADTRAYNRAVMRLSGFGDVSADEIIAGIDEGDPLPDRVPEGLSGLRDPEPLPPESEESVVAACRAWAEGIVGRDFDYAPVSQQASFTVRLFRARARRGNVTGAISLGAGGYSWNGPAQDETGISTFQVGQPPIDPRDLASRTEAVKSASSEQREREDQALAGLGSPGNGISRDKKPTEGWDLSAKGSDQDDAKPAPAKVEKVYEKESADGNIPGPDPNTDCITGGQARLLSKMLLQVSGNDKGAAKQWLRDACSVEKSTAIRINQYELIRAALAEKVKKLTDSKET